MSTSYKHVNSSSLFVSMIAQRSGVAVAFGVLTLLLGLTTGAYAQNPCQIGFRSGTAPSVDGTIGQGEWSDASLLTSDDNCLGDLPQDVTQGSGGVVPTGSGRVEVYTKRNGQNLYVGIKVDDDSDANLQLGEHVILQFDPSKSGGGNLETQNRRIELGHEWGNQFTTEKFYKGKAPSSSNCNYGDWNSQAQFPNSIDKEFSVGNNSYSIEMRIPMGEANVTQGSPFRLSVAVLNDIGKVVNGKSWATASGLPDGLELSDRQINKFGKTFLLKCASNQEKNDWKTPKKWAVGYFQGPGPTLSLSQSPKSWMSSDITAHPCDAMTRGPSYEYNTDATPCEVDVKVDPTRSANFEERTVHFLYLWGNHGAGVDWNFIALKQEDVSSTGSFTSGAYDFGAPPIPDVNGHPCVRVYILPSSLQAGFGRSKIKSVVSNDNLNELEEAYDVNTSKHRAQKNLSTTSNRDDCADCPVAAADPPAGNATPTFADGSVSAETKGAGASQAASIRLREMEGTSAWWGAFGGIAGWWFYVGTLLLALIFVTGLVRRTISRNEAVGLILAAMVLVAGGNMIGCNGVVGDGGVDQSGTVHLSEQEMERYKDTHVLFQTRVGGVAVNKNKPDSVLHLAEEISGAIDVIPAQMMRQQDSVSVTLTVGNPTPNPMSLALGTTIKVPPRLEKTGIVRFTPFGLEEGNTFDPGETRDVTVGQLTYRDTIDREVTNPDDPGRVTPPGDTTVQ